jgi:hypothetical protein
MQPQEQQPQKPQSIMVGAETQLRVTRQQREEASNAAAGWQAAYEELLVSSQETINGLRSQIQALTENTDPPG